MLVLGNIGAPADRPPPHDLNAEKSVLGSVIIKPAAIHEVASELRTDDFFLPAHREVFEAMLAVEKRRVPLDWVAISDELKARGMLGRLDGGEAYLVDLANATPTAENAAHYARVVKRMASLRLLIAVCYETVSGAYGAPTDAAALFAEHQAKVSAAETASGRGLRKFGDLAHGLIDTFEQRMLNYEQTGSVVTGVPFGVRALDELLSGMQPGDLVVVAAPTSVGKTALAMQAIERLVTSDPDASGMAINLEMMDVQLAERMVAHDASVSSYLLKTGKDLRPHVGKIHDSVRRLAATRLYLEDQVTRIDQIRSTLIRWRNESRVVYPDGTESLGIAVVDFAQMIEAMGKLGEETRARQVGQFGKDLKALAKQLRIPIVLVSQLNRSGIKGKERPTLHDLKESGDLENAADVIVLIENKAEKPGGEEDAVAFHVDKNRSGQKATRYGKYVGRHYRFVDDD